MISSCIIFIFHILYQLKLKSFDFSSKLCTISGVIVTVIISQIIGVIIISHHNQIIIIISNLMQVTEPFTAQGQVLHLTQAKL